VFRGHVAELEPLNFARRRFGKLGQERNPPRPLVFRQPLTDELFELFREFREVSPKVWKGKVFVPDLNKVFTGTGTVKDRNTVVARGCLIGNIGCKSQTWTRVR